MASYCAYERAICDATLTTQYAFGRFQQCLNRPKFFQLPITLPKCAESRLNSQLNGPVRFPSRSRGG